MLFSAYAQAMETNAYSSYWASEIMNGGFRSFFYGTGVFRLSRGDYSIGHALSEQRMRNADGIFGGDTLENEW